MVLPPLSIASYTAGLTAGVSAPCKWNLVCAWLVTGGRYSMLPRMVTSPSWMVTVVSNLEGCSLPRPLAVLQAGVGGASKMVCDWSRSMVLTSRSFEASLGMGASSSAALLRPCSLGPVESVEASSLEESWERHERRPQVEAESALFGRSCVARLRSK